jgi:multiple sugar transport system permease protein
VQDSASPLGRDAGPRRRRRVRWRGEWLTGYAMIFPATALIAIFGLFPIGYAIYMSLYRWRIRQGGFVGLDNYEKVLGDWGGAAAFFGGLALILVAHHLWTRAFRAHAGWRRYGPLFGAVTLLSAGIAIALGWGRMVEAGEARFLGGLIRTTYYGFLSVPIQIVLALVLASLLFQRLRGSETFRMLFFLPYVTPAVAGAAVYAALFSPRPERPVNTVLGWLGLPPQDWLFETDPVLELIANGVLARVARLAGTEPIEVALSGFWAGPSLALVTIIVFGIWTYTGYNAVIFLAGLANIPRDLYEAAEIDGANGRQRFLHVTIPMLSPVTFYLTVLGFIGTFQAFTHLYVMRVPATRDAVDTASVVIFDTFYKRNDFSLAAAQSIVLFVIILILTLFNQRVLGGRGAR